MKGLLSKIRTVMFPRPTEQSNTVTAPQQFVESGTSADFKRCVLEHIGYCGAIFAFYGTTTWENGHAYAPGDVISTGTGTVVVGAHGFPQIQLPAAQGYEFVLMGTHTRDRWQEAVQADRNDVAFEAFLQDHNIPSRRPQNSTPLP